MWNDQSTDLLILLRRTATGQQRPVGYLGCKRQSDYSKSMSIAEWRIHS
jgi:hypothetical protein